ncbi:hypothetical protein O988_05873 [Pseudogymnoascus sp. VKM F-3808]|nr:hypothetical protein O988_05873 [Pseudogymnoascus sp. VKM F-3808]
MPLSLPHVARSRCPKWDSAVAVCELHSLGSQGRSPAGIFFVLLLASGISFALYPSHVNRWSALHDIQYKINMDSGRKDVKTSCGYKCSHTDITSDGSMEISNATNNDAISYLVFGSSLTPYVPLSFTANSSFEASSNPSISISVIRGSTIESSLLATHIGIRPVNDGDYLFTSGTLSAETRSFKGFQSACGGFSIDVGLETILQVGKFNFFGPLETRVFRGPNADFALSLRSIGTGNNHHIEAISRTMRVILAYVPLPQEAARRIELLGARHLRKLFLNAHNILSHEPGEETTIKLLFSHIARIDMQKVGHSTKWYGPPRLERGADNCVALPTVQQMKSYLGVGLSLSVRLDRTVGGE